MTPIPKLEDPTRDIAYDAMCVWEWVQDRLGQDAEPLTGLCDRMGAGCLREAMLDLLPCVREAWRRAVDARYENCFDWEFIPWFMENCVDFASWPWRCDINQLPPGCGPAAAPCFALFLQDEPCGTVQEGDGPERWETFATEREAQLEIIDDLEEYIRQFKAGEREFDEIPMPADCYVQAVTLFPDGSLGVDGVNFQPPQPRVISYNRTNPAPPKPAGTETSPE